MPGPTNIRLNPASRVDTPEPGAPGFWRNYNEWHSRVTRRTYHYVGRWVEVSDSKVFWDFCETHQRREPCPEPGSQLKFKSCGNCFHTWLDLAEFIDDVAYLNSRLGLPFKGISDDDYLICPLCNEYF